MATSKVDTNDPHVRRMVYNMYRGILGNYNQQANNIISTLPRERVVEDKGIGRHVESMMRQASQIANSNGNTPHPGGESMHHVAAPPPPPPPPVQGGPSMRIASEIAPTKRGYEPPAAIQNAMMTKDKKPFTYTPGGLDLAEIRSPRMARRINRNAHMEDSCTVPQGRPAVPGQPHSLPPSALAAMQPQIAIPVFPPSGDNSSAVHQIGSAPQYTGVNPPTAPPMPSAVGCPPPPPPPPPMPDGSTSPLNNQFNQSNNNNNNNSNQQSYRPKNGNHSPPTYLQDIQNRPALRPVGQPGHVRPPPDFVSEIPCHSPLKPVNHPPRSSYEPSNAPPIQVQLKPVSPKSVVSPQNSSPPYIPQPPSTPNQQKYPETSSPSLPYNTAISPPKTVQEPNFVQTMAQQKQTPPPPKPSVYIPANQPTSPNVTANWQTPSSPAGLNKSPAPWMTSRQQQRDTPPWTVKTPEDKGTPSPQPAGTGLHTRVIPIQVEGREPVPNYQQQMAQQMQQMQIQMQQQMHQHQRQMQQQMNQNVGGQHSPSLVKQSNTLPRQDSLNQGRTRIIPIQIEGSSSGDVNNQQKNYTPSMYANQQNNSSPVGGYGQNQNRYQNSAQGENLQRTSSVDAADSRSRQLQSQHSWTPGNSNPIQSRSFRVLQKITGSEDQPSVPVNRELGETFLVNRVLPDRPDRLDESEY